MKLSLNRRRQPGRISGSAHQQTHAASIRLGQRLVHGQPRWFAKVAIFGVAGNADNFKSCEAIVEAAADGICSRPELPRHSLVDDGYFGGLIRVDQSKVAPAEQWQAGRLEETRTDTNDVDGNVLAD